MKHAFPWIVMAIYCGLLLANGAMHGNGTQATDRSVASLGAGTSQLPDFIRPAGKFND